MSTDNAHPDAGLLSRLRAAATWWEEQPAVHPTSSVTGGGAVEELERRLAAMHGQRYAVSVPSATLGLRLALQSVGVVAGSEVLVPGLDWSATTEAVISLGARPVPVPVREDDLTIDPAEAAALRTPRTAAAVVCHLHGLVGDVAGLGELTGVPVVEDAAAALGSTRDGVLAGSTGDAAVLSLGPGKRLDAGEGGVLLTSRADVRDRALGLSAHPVRLALDGVPRLPDSLSLRLHPVSALLALHELSVLDLPALRDAWCSAANLAAGDPRVVRVLGSTRHRSAERAVAVTADPQAPAWGSPSGAVARHPECRPLLDAVRLVPVP